MSTKGRDLLIIFLGYAACRMLVEIHNYWDIHNIGSFFGACLLVSLYLMRFWIMGTYIIECYPTTNPNENSEE